MKKLLGILALFCALTFSFNYNLFAQNPDSTGTDSAAATTATTETKTEAASTTTEAAAVPEETSFHQVIKEKFIEGDWIFMTPVLLCMILGLAYAIERIVVLNLASTNTEKLLSEIEGHLKSGNVDRAKDVCAATRGPVASIFAQGLISSKMGIDMAEKSIMSYGSVEMSKLEKNLVWISLFIALAPMLGFLGTVIGMIQAFDAIEAAGDISPSLVAGGIKVALITTVAGLIVAMIIQVFYNYCISKIDSLVTDMEESSIALVDLLIKYNPSSK